MQQNVIEKMYYIKKHPVVYQEKKPSNFLGYYITFCSNFSSLNDSPSPVNLLPKTKLPLPMFYSTSFCHHISACKMADINDIPGAHQFSRTTSS